MIDCLDCGEHYSSPLDGPGPVCPHCRAEQERIDEINGAVAANHRKDARIAELEAEVERLKAVVRRAEWCRGYVDAFGGVRRSCPYCGGIKPGETAVGDYAKSMVGHRPGCAFVAAFATAGLPGDAPRPPAGGGEGEGEGEEHTL